MSNNEREIRVLVEDAKKDIAADNLKDAGDKIRQALELAQNIGNKELYNEIIEFVESFSYSPKPQTIELNRIKTKGFILDIGGGGEGIIGKINGKQVIAIDKNEDELLESQNEALKIVMDATDLKFLPESFSMCTAFFSFMYIPNDDLTKIFEETYRVLTSKGKFMIWDVEIPEKFGDYKAFLVRLMVKLPIEEINTGYGVIWKKQNLEYIKKLAQETNFEILDEWKKDEIFFLELVKR